MSDMVDIATQTKFFLVCQSFYISTKTDSDQSEITRRKQFIQKLYQYLLSIDSSNSQYGYTMNYICGNIIDGNILLNDAYEYFDDKAITSETMTSFIEEYSINSESIRNKLLDKIRIQLLQSDSSGITSLSDLISTNQYFKTSNPLPTGIYVQAKYGYQFVKDSSKFLTEIDALRDFESKYLAFMTAHSAYSASPNSSIAEITEFNKRLFGSITSASDVPFVILHRRGLGQDYDELSWLKEQAFASADTIDSICTRCLTADRYNSIVGDIIAKVYRKYATKVQNYDTKDNELSITEALTDIMKDMVNTTVTKDSVLELALLIKLAQANKQNITPTSNIDAVQTKVLAYAKAAAEEESRLDALRQSFIAYPLYQER